MLEAGTFKSMLEGKTVVDIQYIVPVIPQEKVLTVTERTWDTANWKEGEPKVTTIKENDLINQDHQMDHQIINLEAQIKSSQDQIANLQIEKEAIKTLLAKFDVVKEEASPSMPLFAEEATMK